MTTIRIKKHLFEKIKEEYEDVPINTVIDTVLMEIAIAKKYKPKYVRATYECYNIAGEDTNVRVQDSLLEELRKEFPEGMTINEIVYTLLKPEEEEFRGIYPEQIRAMQKDYPGLSIYEVGLVLRNSARIST